MVLKKCQHVAFSCFVTLIAIATVGCEASKSELQIQNSKGLIWMFPGVEGGPLALGEARRGFRDAGVESRIQTHDYGRPFGLLANLMAYDGNRRAAVGIAKRIIEYRVKHPNTPIDLVGYSGGGGMAVMVAEALPTDVRLRNVMLCQPAISPTYFLSKALRRIDGKLVNLYATNDWFMLGVGTRIFGTMDREYTAAAGKDGFIEPLELDDAKLADHFEQRKWTPDMIFVGHGGMHTGILSYGWNKAMVAPWLTLQSEAESANDSVVPAP